jgi:hypothetical protein
MGAENSEVIVRLVNLFGIKWQKFNCKDESDFWSPDDG